MTVEFRPGSITALLDLVSSWLKYAAGAALLALCEYWFYSLRYCFITCLSFAWTVKTCAAWHSQRDWWAFPSIQMVSSFTILHWQIILLMELYIERFSVYFSLILSNRFFRNLLLFCLVYYCWYSQQLHIQHVSFHVAAYSFCNCCYTGQTLCSKSNQGKPSLAKGQLLKSVLFMGRPKYLEYEGQDEKIGKGGDFFFIMLMLDFLQFK